MGPATIRPERAADIPAIHHVNAEAARPQEAQLVDTLRDTGAVNLSLVATLNDNVVGHIIFSPVHVEDGTEQWTAVALGPMAVLPAWQRQGVGSALMMAALDACRQTGQEIVFVLGHPTYYPRFGFVPAPPLGLTCRWNVPDDVFMVNELTEGALKGRRGIVHYHPAFDAT